ncbi:AraC-like DNA-binding protein [Glaciihabitans tibetensis]|uniref:AraC-like DNA-binding protein n=1 Tax=Glaciihabitans tibetensis TaxID=1266600 RepID=A0A2T0VFS5_9MICO|nr:AraC family transcriptional regulator [Glaciihabitans tibetensis]PRY69051.1 AraC-like DNA-binding protein [Glaciihabitans tibetensis]
MPSDRLSEILDLIEVKSVVSGGSVMRERWQTGSTIDDDLKFIAVVHGHARLNTDGLTEPVELNSGDVAVLNGRTWLTLEGGTGDAEPVRVEPPAAGSTIRAEDAHADGADVLIGGRVELNPAGRELLLRALPPVMHVGPFSSVGAPLRGHVQRLFEEITGNRVGSQFAIRQYGQLLLLDVVRGYMHDADMPAGWLKVLTDERLRPALALIHEQPSKAWSLEELARAASMSRTTFAERFRQTAGTPPLAYLIDWRMLLAQRQLRLPDTRIRSLALELGYSSESAFSNAFKRHLGESPSSYRLRARTTPA